MIDALQFEFILQSEPDIVLDMLQRIDTNISRTVLASRVSDMYAHGYECVAIKNGDDIIGICGIWTLYKYYVGKHIEPDNVYIVPEFRGLGVGQQLMQWLQQLAIERDCEAIELNCYIDNARGQQFWQDAGCAPIGIHFQKKM